MNKTNKIYIAGHTGLVGSALVKKLKKNGFHNILSRTHQELDLRDAEKTANLFKLEKPDYVFMSAALVGGIIANRDRPADFIHDNLMIQTSILHSAYQNNVKKLIFFGSACCYPGRSPQPIREEYLLTGPIEETSKSYAIAKIAGITMCEAYNKQHNTHFFSVIPATLYGPNDNFDPTSSHVLSALIAKFHKAKTENKKTITLWGTGTPKREFLFVDDLADACLLLMNIETSANLTNIGAGSDISIKDLASLIKNIIGFNGEIRWDTTKPDGIKRKLLNSSKIKKLGWTPKTSLEEGIKKTYKWFTDQN